MHDSGELKKALEGCELVEARKGESPVACEGCDSVLFVPCGNCSGSSKVYLEAGGGGFRRCLYCKTKFLLIPT
ncbi:Uncharacterized protein AXF42_Ash009491 [Apostasia shenzhenica]|uniref:Uncharacterized protein n=1 Tax=Apostasia shenzhenica TaxID=1088818 RepID=A0A2I0B941_9ASPA|nr:Uncharacterized protein AXF42_Ash009491 [Apostasia shenzhenica]